MLRTTDVQARKMTRRGPGGIVFVINSLAPHANPLFLPGFYGFLCK